VRRARKQESKKVARAREQESKRAREQGPLGLLALFFEKKAGGKQQK
jgi:hypothetical protein